MEYFSNVGKSKIEPKNSLLKLEKDTEIEDNMIKDERNLFRLKKKTTKETEDNIIKDVVSQIKKKKQQKK